MGRQGPKTCTPGTVLDLGGRQLGGGLPGDQLELVLGVPGLALRNGTLALPEGAHLTVVAPDVRLEDVTFIGAGPEGAFDHESRQEIFDMDSETTVDVVQEGAADITGLVVVEGAGCSVVLER